jgi:hypothetical protein
MKGVNKTIHLRFKKEVDGSNIENKLVIIFKPICCSMIPDVQEGNLIFYPSY